ncbi:MAG: glycosyltransferase [Phycisphaerales bacterium]
MLSTSAEARGDVARGGVAAPPTLREFDGVICFGGEDWWYHNRGHYDMQMMRELSRVVPVLYVNSIGMRVPRVGEGRMFLTRVRRKLKSLRRGLVEARPNFWVFSPFSVPGRFGGVARRRVMPLMVRRAAKRLGIRKPLVWVACPPGEQAVGRLGEVGVVYQRTDRYERFRGVDPEEIKGYDLRLKDAADFTVFCATLLYEEERDECRRAVYIDHGVDYERFASAGVSGAEPLDLVGMPRPRAGFVGGIDSHTFDPPLFVDVAKRLPHVYFMMVGACSLPEGWCDLPNVRFFGQRPYEEVARYMASCDVLLMPWNESEWIKGCNPVKLKEYLAVGRPVVTTWFEELKRYEGHTHVAKGSEAFARAIEEALRQGNDAETQRSRVRNETWDAKGLAALDALRESGLTPSTLRKGTRDVA